MHRASRFFVNRLLPAGAVLLAFAAPAAAQKDMALATSPALACLTIAGGGSIKPDYPADALKRKDGGTVKVQLEFRGPGEMPRVTVLEHAESSELNHVVAYHVQQFRVPCMEASAGPVTLVQAYTFDPDGASRVVASPTRDAADAERAAQMKCLRHRIPDSKPEYPRQSLKTDEEGDLIVKLHFAAREQAPTVEFVGGSASPRLRTSVEEHADGLRLPCMGDKPVHVLIVYKFLFGDSEHTILRDVGLAKLLGATKDLARPAYFNFNAMTCPFDVRLTYRRPFVSNKVEQLDTAVAAREPLLDWLEALTLNVNDQKNANLFGSKMIVTVPCGKLDI